MKLKLKKKKIVIVFAIAKDLDLSLFAAIHKPPMPVPMPMPAPCPCQQMMFRPDFGPQHFYRGHRGDFHKKMMKHRMENNAPRPVQEADD